MEHISSTLGLSEIAIEKVLDFLPYPFLVSEWRAGNQRNLFVNKVFVEEIGFTCLEIPTITAWFEKAYPEKEYRTKVMDAWEQACLQARDQHSDVVIVKAKIATRTKGMQWYEVKASISGALNMVAFVNINEEIIKESKLEQLNEDKNRILSILSHDLRSPLINLHALISLSAEELVSQAEFNACVKNIGTRTFNLIEFLDTTLQWTRANFEGINPEILRVDLAEMAVKVCALYEKAYQEKGIEVNLDLKEQYLFSDPEIISIVLRNVLSNAIKFTSAGRIVICSHRDDDCFVLSVQDSGAGISPSQITAILNGQQKSTEGTQQEKGFGLGLRLCTDLLKKVGGELRIENVPEKGTTVRIVIKDRPVHEEHNKPAGL